MTQFYIDADNGLDVGRDGLAPTSTTHSITSSSVANPTNILCTGHGLISTDETIIAGHSGSTPAIDGTHVATRIDDDNFTIPVNVTTGGTGGTSTDNDGPWKTFHKFTENSRSAADIATCRRGMTAEYDDGGNLSFTSDGTILLPIVLEADYADSWSDDVTTAGETYTTTFGSTTINGSGALDATIVTGAWVYVSTDDNRLHSYEVASTSSNDVILYLPFKGTVGSGLTLIVMPSSPLWDQVADTAKWDLNGDNYWKFQGIQPQGTQPTSNAGITDLFNCAGHQYKDMTYIANNSKGYGVVIELGGKHHFSKCRTFDGIVMRNLNNNFVYYNDCLFDGNGISNIFGAETGSEAGGMKFEDCIFKGQTVSNAVGISLASGTNRSDILKLRNCEFETGTVDSINNTNGISNRTFIEDVKGVPGDTEYMDQLASADSTALYESEKTTVRSGGATISQKVTPGTNIGPESVWSTVILLDISIYATTASKKYEIFFRPDATANWTADPTAAQLWVELEAWGHASNNSRLITKSTGVIDMNGSTTWTALDVTVAPAQSGVAYLRVKYTKPKESGKTNVFFIDPLPVIT